MSKPTNFRREVKNLWKNYQRGEISEKQAIEDLESRGILINDLSYVLTILKFKVPSRIFSRLGKAARKKQKFVFASDICITWNQKFGGLKTKLGYEDFHLIPFWEISEKTIKVKIFKGPDGKTFIPFQRFENVVATQSRI